jgi:amidase
MLDSMVGFSRISPISVAPPWQSALADLERREDIKGLRIAYVSDIAGIGVEAEIDATCRDAAAALGKLGAHVEQIAFDASAGRAPYQIWRGFWMVGRQYEARANRRVRPQSERQRRSRTETERDRLCRRRAGPHGHV